VNRVIQQQAKSNKQNERKAMKTVNGINKSWMWAAAALQVVLGAGAAVPYRTEVPPDPWAPVWVRPLGDPELNVVVWIFYRAPENVPADFDIIQFADLADRNGNGVWDPWDYPLLMEGFAMWDELGPWFSSLREIDVVPIWFTSFDEAISLLTTPPYTITIAQLSAMTSLKKGSASFYYDQLHLGLPHTQPVPVWTYMARGSVEDGRSFSLHVTGNEHYSQFYKLNDSFTVEFK
jgi:hypothetical protein